MSFKVNELWGIFVLLKTKHNAMQHSQNFIFQAEMIKHFHIYAKKCFRSKIPHTEFY